MRATSPRRLAPLAPLALLLGCGGEQLSQSWQLDRLRILAVRAEPAEPRPGEQVDFEALYYLPPGQELELAIWFACLPTAADEFGCSIDEELLASLQDLDPEGMTPEELAALYAKLSAAGLIGAEPLLPPSWTAPAAALDGLDEQGRLEGVSAVVNISAVPAGAGLDTGDPEAMQAATELAYKRLPISEAQTPNHNPDVVGFLVDGQPVAPDAVVRAEWGATLTLDPVLADDAIETYLYRTEEGVDEERVEEPFVSWYTEAGAFDQSYSLYPTSDAEWTAPSAAEASDLGLDQVRVIAVIRDRRGGMGWAALTIDFTDGVDASARTRPPLGVPGKHRASTRSGATCQGPVRAP